MSKFTTRLISVFLVLSSLLYTVSTASAGVNIYAEGNLEQSETGIRIDCNTDDILTLGKDIELWSDYTGNDPIINEITGYTISVNGQLYNHYSGNSMRCHVPFQVWHSSMIDDTRVYVSGVINTTQGRGHYDYMFTVDQSQVKPLCTEHMFVFNLEGIEDVKVKQCEKDPLKHYLASCIGNYKCSVCGEETAKTRFTFDESNSPSITDHVLNDHRCVAEGCDYVEEEEVQISYLYLNVENDGWWMPGNDYIASVEWGPEDAKMEDIRWEIGYRNLYKEEPENDVATIVSANGDQAVFHADSPGYAYIFVYTNNETKNIAKGIEVRDAANDKDVFYETLSSLGENEHPMDNPVIRAVIRNELMTITNQNKEQTDAIIQCIENADYPYQDLYVWSFYDYFKSTTPDTEGSYHWYGKLQVDCSEDEFSTDTFFHESGHAVDFALYESDMTEKEYKEKLYNALYYSIYQMVSEEVIKAARNTELTYDEKSEIIEYIMGDKYLFEYYSNINIWAMKKEILSTKAVMTDEFSDQQKDVFDSAVSAVGKILKDHPYVEDISSHMLSDIAAGCTNQVVMGNSPKKDIIGHGPLTHELVTGDERKLYTTTYWYDEKGNPTYYQNKEAWAEYFSSRMTGNNLESNQQFFEEACNIMDQMAEELLEGYKAKHRVN